MYGTLSHQSGYHSIYNEIHVSTVTVTSGPAKLVLKIWQVTKVSIYEATHYS